jgi:hypothetical protein
MVLGHFFSKGHASIAKIYILQAIPINRDNNIRLYKSVNVLIMSNREAYIELRDCKVCTL